MQENLHQPNDACVVDFDSGIANQADGDRQGQPLQQREIHMNVERLSLEAGEVVGDGVEPFAYGVQVIESFLQAEVAQVVGAKLVAEKTGELLVLFEEACFQ